MCCEGTFECVFEHVCVYVCVCVCVLQMARGTSSQWQCQKASHQGWGGIREGGREEKEAEGWR